MVDERPGRGASQACDPVRAAALSQDLRSAMTTSEEYLAHMENAPGSQASRMTIW